LHLLAKHRPPDFDVLVVDDGSTDNTAEVAQACGAMCLRLPIHLGYGGALQTGYKFALRRRYEFLVQLDADGQHDPAGIPALLAPLLAGEADLVIGNRFHEEYDYPSPLVRDIGRRFFAILCRGLTGFALRDPTSGFKALNRKTLALLVKEGFPLDFPDADVFIMMHYCGIRFREVNVRMWPSPEKTSMHAGFFHPIRYSGKILLSILMVLLRQLGGPHD
jgi:glycosyltransferase involved in cell wall biosynthesis